MRFVPARARTATKEGPRLSALVVNSAGSQPAREIPWPAGRVRASSNAIGGLGAIGRAISSGYGLLATLRTSLDGWAGSRRCPPAGVLALPLAPPASAHAFTPASAGRPPAANEGPPARARLAFSPRRTAPHPVPSFVEGLPKDTPASAERPPAANVEAGAPGARRWPAGAPGARRRSAGPHGGGARQANNRRGSAALRRKLRAPGARRGSAGARR